MDFNFCTKVNLSFNCTFHELFELRLNLLNVIIGNSLKCVIWLKWAVPSSFFLHRILLLLQPIGSANPNMLISPLRSLHFMCLKQRMCVQLQKHTVCFAQAWLSAAGIIPDAPFQDLAIPSTLHFENHPFFSSLLIYNHC